MVVPGWAVGLARSAASSLGGLGSNETGSGMYVQRWHLEIIAAHGALVYAAKVAV